MRSFEELTDNPSWAEELRRVYDDDIDRVDLTVGLFAEHCPKGFGFSDTAFRIFILMASRRLNSDRFFTDGLHAEGLHRRRASTGSTTTTCRPCCSATSRSSSRRCARSRTPSRRGRASHKAVLWRR